MTRLIDADALKESIDEHVYLVHHGFNETEYGCTQYGIHQIIDEQPTIDAVPLSMVRKAAKKLAYIHKQIDLYGDRPDLHDEEYWLEYLMDEEWKDPDIE